MARTERSALATVISIFFVVLYVGVFVASMVALGYTVDTGRDLSKINKQENCILQIKTGDYISNDRFIVVFEESSRCDFIIGGNAVLGVFAVLLMILSVIRALLGKW